jgi:hypothetical protein
VPAKRYINLTKGAGVTDVHTILTASGPAMDPPGREPQEARLKTEVKQEPKLEAAPDTPKAVAPPSVAVKGEEPRGGAMDVADDDEDLNDLEEDEDEDEGEEVRVQAAEFGRASAVRSALGLDTLGAVAGRWLQVRDSRAHERRRRRELR